MDDDFAPNEHSWSVGMGRKVHCASTTIFLSWNIVILARLQPQSAVWISWLLLAQNRLQIVTVLFYCVILFYVCDPQAKERNTNESLQSSEIGKQRNFYDIHCHESKKSNNVSVGVLFKSFFILINCLIKRNSLVCQRIYVHVQWVYNRHIHKVFIVQCNWWIII